MDTESPTLSTQLVLGTPLQVSTEGDETVVHIRNRQGEKVELKRFTPEQNR